MLVIDGSPLSLEVLELVAQGKEQVSLCPDSLERMSASRRHVDAILTEGRVVYGVNTGFGKLSDITIPDHQVKILQTNLVRSHACGVGEPLTVAQARAMLLLRANVLAKGFSGARPVVAETLVNMLNGGVTPVIPSRGSVGASGDLAPLAHLALVVIGEGEAFLDGVRLSGAKAMALAKINPIELQAKEGLALLNGTQAICAVGGLALAKGYRLAGWATAAGAVTLEALLGTPAAFDPRIHAARNHSCQQQVAAQLLALLQDSQIRESHREGDSRV
ncbi:MAG TPA: aromatic amino acid lyase, partial [Fimbriimonadaceae bacterium]|nr:aromatic amino acid lyase [Fimbriimonadaceae bacterium]